MWNVYQRTTRPGETWETNRADYWLSASIPCEAMCTERALGEAKYWTRLSKNWRCHEKWNKLWQSAQRRNTRVLEICSFAPKKNPAPAMQVTLAKENSRHFATPPLVSPQNERRNSILMTCTIQIWVGLLIDWSKYPARPIRSTSG